MGKTGREKSTLIKIISGVYTRDSGFLHLEGKEMSFANPKDAMDAGIRVIHQEINMAQTLTVAENIFLGNYPTRHGIIDWKELYKNARKVMEILGDSIDVEQKVSKVSIAEQQMIEIAKAVSVELKGFDYGRAYSCSK
ncbi:MAG: ATP-binding cassette domain-containing protein [Enterocloster bolteae]